jgi:hypothetical protein
MPEKDTWALPPIEKIYEAFSAIADDRVKLSGGSATVSSSDYNKEYTVMWNGDYYSSNDNASYWQGYMGYPLIAVLMLQGKIGYDPAIPVWFKNINWKKLNSEYKNIYSKAAESVLESITAGGADIDLIKYEANKIFEQLKQLNIRRKRSPVTKK